MTTTPRRANGSRQANGADGESPFILLPWGKEQDEAFDAWISAPEAGDPMSFIDIIHGSGLGLKIGTLNGSVYATIDSPDARAKGLKPLLSGWSDSWQEALAVAFFKWDQLLLRDFSHPTPATTRSRRR